MTATENSLYQQVLKNMQLAAETNLKLQQEMFQQWTAMWPGFMPVQQDMGDKVRDFQKRWRETITELAQKHRSLLNSQYDTALESLEQALQVGESTNPEEFRERSEQLCRKTLDCLRDLSETQMNEFQEAVAKWSDLVTQAVEK